MRLSELLCNGIKENLKVVFDDGELDAMDLDDRRESVERNVFMLMWGERGSRHYALWSFVFGDDNDYDPADQLIWDWGYNNLYWFISEELWDRVEYEIKLFLAQRGLHNKSI